MENKNKNKQQNIDKNAKEDKEKIEAEDNHKEKIEELEDNWKRALADYQNLEKRVEKEKRQVIRFANSVLILKVLPILDNLETMRKHSDEEGLDMIVKEFERVLREEGLEEIKAEGNDFDPNNMEAIEMVEGKENKVIEVTKKGYTYKDKVLRPAEVKVGKGKEN